MSPVRCKAIHEIKATNARHLTVDHEAGGCRSIIGFEELAARPVCLNAEPG